MSEDLGAPSNGAGESIVDSGVQAQTGAGDSAPQQHAGQSAEVSEKPAESARQALERAFEKVNAQPEGQQTAPKADRVRDETGKFVKSDSKPQNSAEQAKPAADLAKAAEQQAQQQVKPAPQRFSKTVTPEVWAQTPEPVRAEVERALGELTQGIEKYRGAAEAFEPVRKYHDMAAQGGTTLEKALDAYVGIENAWRQNPAQGFAEVCRNMGVQPMQMLQAIAQGFQGGQVQMPHGDSPQVAALKNELAQLKSQLGEFGKTFTETQQQARQRQVESTVEAFAKDPAHPHFDEVSDSVAHMLETGFAKDLQDAYDKAIRLNPEVAAKIEASKQTTKPDPAQTREKANKSITGSPATGSHPATRQVPDSPRKALEGAFAQLGL